MAAITHLALFILVVFACAEARRGRGHHRKQGYGSYGGNKGYGSYGGNQGYGSYGQGSSGSRRKGCKHSAKAWGQKWGNSSTTDTGHNNTGHNKTGHHNHRPNMEHMNHGTPPPTTVATTTTTAVPEQDLGDKLAAVWNHITATTETREVVQVEVLSSILVLAEQAELLCVDKSVHSPTEADDVVFICKDEGKARFTGVNDIIDRQNFVETINGM